MRILVAVLVIAILVAFYFVSWRLNRKQELPDEVKEAMKSCGDCNLKGCGLHPEQRGDEDE